MNFRILAIFSLYLLLTFVFAQEDEEPLIPNRGDSTNEKPNYIGVKDPFAPTVVTTPSSSPAEEQQPTSPINNPAPVDSQENLGGLTETTEPSPQKTDSNWEEELLNGNDEDFKPAPLKVEGQQDLATPTAEVTPTTSTETIITPQNDLDFGETNSEATATPTPSPTPVIQRQLPQEQIKPADLITEEIDPWDDPRKKISTTCRLQLERIKKKKKLFERAEATQMKLQESLSAGKGDLEKMKQVSGKLSIKIMELKKELIFLKERGVRQGCPGIYF